MLYKIPAIILIVGAVLCYLASMGYYTQRTMHKYWWLPFAIASIVAAFYAGRLWT